MTLQLWYYYVRTNADHSSLRHAVLFHAYFSTSSRTSLKRGVGIRRGSAGPQMLCMSIPAVTSACRTSLPLLEDVLYDIQKKGRCKNGSCVTGTTAQLSPHLRSMAK